MTEPRTITIVVPGRPPNPNRIRGHWAKRNGIAQRWKQLAWGCALEQLPVRWRPMERATLEVVHVVPTKAARDHDNLVAGIKPCLDGLVRAGVVVDDSDRVLVSVTHRPEYEKGVAATRYTFTEVVA